MDIYCIHIACGLIVSLLIPIKSQASAPNNFRAISKVVAQQRGRCVQTQWSDGVYRPRANCEVKVLAGRPKVRTREVRIFGQEDLVLFSGEAAGLRHYFKGTGLVYTPLKGLGHGEGGTFEYIGNCHTVVTAAHVLFNPELSLRNKDSYFLPQGVVRPHEIPVNIKQSLSDRQLFYFKGKGKKPKDYNKNAKYDLVAIRLKNDFPNFGAYRIHPLTDKEIMGLEHNGQLYEVGFQGDKIKPNGAFTMTLDR